MPVPNSAYRGQNTANTHLKWDEFVTPSIPVVTTDFAPGEHERPWQPISSTLVYGLWRLAPLLRPSPTSTRGSSSSR